RDPTCPVRGPRHPPRLGARAGRAERRAGPLRRRRRAGRGLRRRAVDTTRQPRPLHEWFLEDLEPNGYVAGLPPWGNPANTAVDREVAAGATCASCGEVGQDYWPVHNPAERGYRAFTRCPACGHLSEF